MFISNIQLRPPLSFLCRTIFELTIQSEKYTLSYDDQEELLFGTTTILSKGVSLNSWKSVYVTFNPNSNATVHIDTGSSQAEYSTDIAFPSTTIELVRAGPNYNGLIQDLQIYVPSLETTTNQIIVPQEAAFLSLCLCPSGYPSLTQSQDSCTNGSEIIERQVVSNYPGM